jgi:hypothetical protein
MASRVFSSRNLVTGMPVGHEGAVAARVELPRHAEQLVLGRVEPLVQGVDDGVEGVGDGDDDGVRTVLLDALGHLIGHPEVGGQQLLAAGEGAVGACLARHARGVDDQLCALEAGIVLGGHAAHVFADGGKTLEDVQGLALGDRLLLGHLLALGGIIGVHERRRVGETHLAGETPLDDLLGENAADVSTTDQANLLEHCCSPFSEAVQTLDCLSPSTRGSGPRGLRKKDAPIQLGAGSISIRPANGYARSAPSRAGRRHGEAGSSRLGRRPPERHQLPGAPAVCMPPGPPWRGA